MDKYQQAKELYAQQQEFNSWDEYIEYMFSISLDLYEIEMIYDDIHKIYLTL